MLKYIAILFNTLALLIYNLFFADVVTVTQKVPAAAKPQTEFTVELIINKGTIGGFAKLQQEIPEGLTAIEDKSDGASFTFSNQSVKFIWLSMPSDKEIKLSYKLKADAGVSGDKILSGKFSYIVDNEKQVVNISPATVKISFSAPSGEAIATTAQSTQTEIPSKTQPESKPKTPISTGISALRKVPETVTSEFLVEVNVSKGNLSGFAKLIDILPAGFTATPIQTAGASFTFEDQKVKFVWLSIPGYPEFQVVYKVNVPETITGKQTIEGAFSFIEDDETKKLTIPISTINIGGTLPVATNTVEAEVSNTVEPVATNTVAPPMEPAPVAVVKENPKPKQEEKQLSATTIPTPKGNVRYSVQIAALHKAKAPEVISAYYKITEQVNTEMQDGFTKYTIGSYNEYKQGHDAREEAKTKGVHDAWVTSYNNGKRITVQEALMISNQKWYK